MFHRLGSYFGRVLIAVYFIWTGLNAWVHFSGIEKDFTVDVLSWYNALDGSIICDFLLSISSILLAASIAIQLIGGIFLVFSRTKNAALLLTCFVAIQMFFKNGYLFLEESQKIIATENVFHGFLLIGALSLVHAVSTLIERESLEKEALDLSQH